MIACLIAYKTDMVTPNPLGWALVALYICTGVTFLLFGMLLDARERYQCPQKIEVLLRHDGNMWLLNVLRSATGEVYAPGDRSMRQLKSITTIPDTVLGCPKFTPHTIGDRTRFTVLGQEYWSN